ncbi:MAG: translation initiation factor IF-3, partial [Gammaproteobacteria bacterium]|nr:translation initiation factor IF-3 [Gammaproteobacteria bacterium]
MAVDKKTRLNEEITSPEIRLIAKDGEQVGVVTIQDALTMADEVELDLVEIVPTAEPPVCRIMDYGKFVFEQTKKKHAS